MDILEKIFKSACEEDIMNNPHKVNIVLDEIIQAGVVIEPNIVEILEILKSYNIPLLNK